MKSHLQLSAREKARGVPSFVCAVCQAGQCSDIKRHKKRRRRELLETVPANRAAKCGIKSEHCCFPVRRAPTWQVGLLGCRLDPTFTRCTNRFHATRSLSNTTAVRNSVTYAPCRKKESLASPPIGKSAHSASHRRRKSPQRAETEKQAGHSLRWTANMGFQSQHKTRKIKRYLILFKQHIYIYNCVCACVCVWCKRRKALIMLSITTLPVIICLESMSTVFAIHNQRLKVLQPPVTPPAVEHKRLAQRSRRKNHGKTNSKTIGCIITAVTRTDTNKLAR